MRALRPQGAEHHIEALGREIDRRVYELYGSTEAEIEIVEGV
jgi:hypothetical protein